MKEKKTMKLSDAISTISKMGLLLDRASVNREKGIIKLANNIKGKYAKFYYNLQTPIVELTDTKNDNSFQKLSISKVFRAKERLPESGIYKLERLAEADGIAIYKLGDFIKNYQPRK